MVSAMGRGVLAITDQSLVRSLFTDTRPGRALSTRFVAGETLGQAATVAGQLNATGARVSLDHLGEHVSDPAQAASARDDYLEALDRIAADGLDANISVKLTQLGLGLDDALAVASLDALAARAADMGASVTIDMEESRHTAATLDVFEHVQRAHGNVGIALQAYLRRTREDLDRVVALGGHVRLCKGAYSESAAVAFQSKHDVNQNFDRMAMLLMGSEKVQPAMATHDGARIAAVRELASDREGYYEVQMLYGVRPSLQQELMDAGVRVRVYVPYGQAWYPYLTRRLAERPSNMWFFLRAAVSRG